MALPAPGEEASVITYLARRVGAAIVVVPGMTAVTHGRRHAAAAFFSRYQVRNACLPVVSLIGLSHLYRRHLTVIGNLVADVALPVADPRTRLARP